LATNKHAIIRYQTLDKCFRNPGRKYFIDDLVTECNNAIYDFSGISDGVKRRQVYDDITFMESEQGWSVPLQRRKEGRKVFLRYDDTNFSINNSPLNSAEENQLKEALLTLSRLKGMPNFAWVDEITTRINAGLDLSNQSSKVIEFDQNQYLKGIEFINPLYTTIIDQKVICISYQSFKQETVQRIILHPYFLKQYNNRWFLFGLNNEYNSISNLALDRIIKIDESDIRFEKQNKIKFEEFFDDMIGVTLPEGASPQKIILKINAKAWPYIKTKPLHGSQKIKDVTQEFTIVELNLIINYELVSLLFSYSEDLTVVEPLILVDEIRNKAMNLLKSYL
jgi:predicted DNA-binding transcriptional regulator YafY